MTPLGDPRICFDKTVTLQGKTAEIVFPAGSVWKVNTAPADISSRDEIEIEEVFTGGLQYLSNLHLVKLLFSRSDAVVIMTRKEANRRIIRSIGSG